MASYLASSRRLKGDAPLSRDALAAAEHVIHRRLLNADDVSQRSLASDNVLGLAKGDDACGHGGMIDCSIIRSIEIPIARENRRIYSLGGMGTLGKRVEARLSELGKSQRWLAEQIGIKQPSINAIIKGEKARGTKYLVEIAAALEVSPEWLSAERGQKFPNASPQALLVGKVGAGAEVTRFDDGTVLEGIDPPPGAPNCNAAVISGDSMHPLQDGWIVFYGQEFQGVPESAIGKMAIVQVKDGPILLKTLKPGSRKGLWRLESWNAPAREDVKVEWAAKVIDIRPR